MYIKHGALGNCPQTWNAIQTVISAIARKKSMWTIANQFLISDDFSAYLDPSGHARDWELMLFRLCLHSSPHPRERKRERESRTDIHVMWPSVLLHLKMFGRTQKMDAVISINCSQQATHTLGKKLFIICNSSTINNKKGLMCNREKTKKPAAISLDRIVDNLTPARR